MVRTWLALHADESMQCWKMAVNGIDPIIIHKTSVPIRFYLDSVSLE